MVVVLEDGRCCGQAAREEASTPGPTGGTVVLIGREGSRQAIEVEGELLKKVKALIEPAATRGED